MFHCPCTYDNTIFFMHRFPCMIQTKIKNASQLAIILKVADDARVENRLDGEIRETKFLYLTY